MDGTYNLSSSEPVPGDIISPLCRSDFAVIDIDVWFIECKSFYPLTLLCLKYCDCVSKLLIIESFTNLPWRSPWIRASRSS